MNRRKILRNIALSGSAIALGFHKTKAELEQIAFEPAYFNQNETIKTRLLYNENPYGPSDKVKTAVSSSLALGNRYPVEEYKQLTEMIAKEENVSPDNILIGAGSTEFLLLCGMYYGLKGGKILSCSPSYSTLTGYIKNFKAIDDSIALDKNYATDIVGLSKNIKPETSLIYICNPNNPTGTAVDTVKLRSFCEFASQTKPVLVDEAYIEFLDNHKQASMVDQVRKGNNVIVLKTFSKIYGLAGLRIGYMIAPRPLMEDIGRLHASLSSVSSYSLRAAIAAYQDKDFVELSRQKIATSRQFTESALASLGYTDFIPSVTNFMLFPIHREGEAFKKEMLSRGVAIKVWNFENKHWCRVSMGTSEEMKQFAEALKHC